MKNIPFLRSLCLLYAISIVPAYAYQTKVGRNYSAKHHAEKINSQIIKLAVSKIIDKGSYKTIQIKLNKKDGQSVSLNELKKIHTEKIHLLIIDDSLEDYSHIHPRALQDTGIYEFEWRPQKRGKYRIWANFSHVDDKYQKYAFTDLIVAPINEKKGISRLVKTENKVAGYTFQMFFDQKNFSVGKPIMSKIVVKDNDGNPVEYLEPIMGAFAHVVGFPEDMASILHVHPRGKEPAKISDRAGPELEFYIEPKTPGFTKFFAQVKIKGEEICVPFAIFVK